MEETVHIIGHSFIKRLHHFCEKQNGDNLFNTQPAIEAKFTGIPGANISRISIFLSSCKLSNQLSNKTVLLQIGENDIKDDTCDSRKLADEILMLARIAVNVHKASKVIICQLMKREARKYFVPLNYNEKVDHINERLQFLCKFFPRITYWKHKRLITNLKNLLSDDGVHLSQRGLSKYYRSIRGALLNM